MRTKGSKQCKAKVDKSSSKVDDCSIMKDCIGNFHTEEKKFSVSTRRKEGLNETAGSLQLKREFLNRRLHASLHRMAYTCSRFTFSVNENEKAYSISQCIMSTYQCNASF
ncbi:hypothetical protein KP509_17G082200 [Ceratopteris richardii]|uniref:Uncharacterized protein n=1 Tax=Ceratopteris richardii TaxID=49495 RepID=A0A8T2SXY3_CERRI|nr:hypothetical protein KP509_17G082200 [Ceratopteris richardii]